MPEDAKTEAAKLQKQFYGDARGLANHLAKISLTKTVVVYEVFLILNDYSKLDVGCAFIKACNYFQLVKTNKGLFLCVNLHKWLTEIKLPLLQPTACAGNTATLMLLKTAIDTAKPEPEKDKAEESRYYTIDAGIVLADEAVKFLDLIGVKYFKRVGKKFNVNSGTRTPSRQASAMLGVIEAGDRTLSKYGNRQAINEILNAYRTGKSPDEKIKAMTAVIEDQVNRNIFISNHLRAEGIDIATAGDKATAVPAMSAAEEKIMIEIAKGSNRRSSLQGNVSPAYSYSI